MNGNIQRILITGIGGFIGSHAAERAAASGFEVVGIELDQQKARIAADLAPQAHILVGDLLDPDVRKEALDKPVDVVLNTAAIVKDTGKWDVFRRLNVEGAALMAADAKKRRVRLFVQLSSMMVYGFDYPENVDETGPLNVAGHPYCGTKIEGEERLLTYQSASFDVLFVRPGDVYGARCIPWIERPLDMMANKQFFLAGKGDGIMNATYVDNLIDAIFLLLERGVGGEAYNITDGAPVTFREYFTAVARFGGFKEPRSLPLWLVRTIARAYSLRARLTGGEADLNPEAIRFVLRPHAISIAKAKRDLGYDPKITLEEGLRLTFQQ